MPRSSVSFCLGSKGAEARPCSLAILRIRAMCPAPLQRSQGSCSRLSLIDARSQVLAPGLWQHEGHRRPPQATAGHRRPSQATALIRTHEDHGDMRKRADIEDTASVDQGDAPERMLFPADAHCGACSICPANSDSIANRRHAMIRGSYIAVGLHFHVKPTAKV